MIVTIAAFTSLTAETRVVRGPYLQSASTNAVTICWRTDSYLPSRVFYGTNAAAPDSLAFDVTEKTEHALRLTGLAPDTVLPLCAL
jgi:hypothetical protein